MPDKLWLILHNKVEDNLTYTNLLFIPTNKPFGLFRSQAKSRVKLYLRATAEYRRFQQSSQDQLQLEY